MSWRIVSYTRMPPRQKMSRAANRVNRECGTECVIGVGSGELLGHGFVITQILVKTVCCCLNIRPSWRRLNYQLGFCNITPLKRTNRNNAINNRSSCGSQLSESNIETLTVGKLPM